MGCWNYLQYGVAPIMEHCIAWRYTAAKDGQDVQWLPVGVSYCQVYDPFQLTDTRSTCFNLK